MSFAVAGAGANAFQNPMLGCGPCGPAAGGDSAALSIAIAISVNNGAPAEAAAEAGKQGKNGKHGKLGKNGKNGKHGKNGKNGKEKGVNSPLHNNAAMAIAMAMSSSNANGCGPMGQMGGMQGNQQQQMLMGLMVGLMLANQQNSAMTGANPGMGGFLNQFNRPAFCC